ncbi:hypothetical protein [Streptomyces sp. NPDC093111]|uniref:hypothetical protein n=1 Tax=Streptomyces sp. NPDC093111 TaxID=3154978 RepID=UPI00341E9893
MEMLGPVVFLLVAAVGVAFLVDFKGIRRHMVSRPGESDEDIERFQPIAMIVGVLFTAIPLAAVAHSIIS